MVERKNAFRFLMSWYIAALCKSEEISLGLLEPCTEAAPCNLRPSLSVFLVRLPSLSCALLSCVDRLILLLISTFDQIMI